MSRASTVKKNARTLRPDGEATYNRILEVAGELFAATGFAETTSKMVAAKAEVDLASINYHFGGRVGLYEAVLIEAHNRLISLESLEHLVASNKPANEKLRALMEMLVENATSDNSWHARVLSRELLAPTSHIRTLRDRVVPSKLPFVMNIIGEITGLSTGDPALLRCLISVVAQCALLLVVGRNVPPFADDIRNMPRKDLVAHLYGFAIGGLEAIRSQHAAPARRNTGRNKRGR